MKIKFFEEPITLRVLLYHEDGEFVARALELDLVGFGATEKEALNELAENVDTQIEFARFKDDLSLLWANADPELFHRWENARSGLYRRNIFGDKSMAIRIPKLKTVKALQMSLTPELSNRDSKTHKNPRFTVENPKNP